MKVPINLASQPYENLRPYYTGAALALALLIALTAAVTWNVNRNRRETRVLTQRKEQMDRDFASLRKEEVELSQWLARPEVQDIRDRSSYLNSLIVRKSLSWTQIFMDLEKVLPGQVQVTSIRPSLEESAQAKLSLLVSANSVPPLIEFLKNLEASPEFEKPVVDSQQFPNDKSVDPGIMLGLTVSYRPAPQSPASASESPAGTAGDAERPSAVVDSAPQAVPPATPPVAPPGVMPLEAVTPRRAAEARGAGPIRRVAPAVAEAHGGPNQIGVQ